MCRGHALEDMYEYSPVAAVVRKGLVYVDGWLRKGRWQVLSMLIEAISLIWLEVIARLAQTSFRSSMQSVHCRGSI